MKTKAQFAELDLTIRRLKRWLADAAPYDLERIAWFKREIKRRRIQRSAWYRGNKLSKLTTDLR